MEEFNRRKFMKDYKSAVIAKSLHNGEAAIIKCIEFDDKQEIQVLLNDERNVDIEIDLESLMIKNAVDNEECAHSYNPEIGTLEAYWLALHEIDYFDSEPEIEVIGEIDTLGSPYDEMDDSGVIY
jgi:hypothetical protein